LLSSNLLATLQHLAFQAGRHCYIHVAGPAKRGRLRMPWTIKLASVQRSWHSSFRSRAGRARNWRSATRPSRPISRTSSSSSPAVILSSYPCARRAAAHESGGDAEPRSRPSRLGSGTRLSPLSRRLHLFMSGRFCPFVEQEGYLGWYLSEGARAYSHVGPSGLSRLWELVT
jgi:hypothetical protein